MAYLIVVALSLLVGGGVYLATLRAAREGPVAVGFDGGAAPPGDEGPSEGPGAGYTYLRIAIRGPSWRDRVQGVVGLLILLVIATAALAFGIYQLGHLVNLTIGKYFES